MKPSNDIGQTGVKPRPASQRSNIASFIVMDVMRAAAAKEAGGERVIHMEVGQPGTPAPAGALAAVSRAMASETLGYTLALGMPALRQRIAQHYQEQHGIAVSADRIAITNGSSAAFVLSFLSLFDAGDRVGLPSPGYPCYRQILSALGQQPVMLETTEASRWMPTASQVDEAITRDGLSGLLIASPSNPTGTVIEPQRLAEIIEVCQRRGIWFVSDEIYHGLTYDAPAETALRYSDDAVIINSFSKYFSMTGWRVGWMVVPERLVRTVERLAQHFYISPPAVAQVAALGAFDSITELEANKQVYAANRALLLEELPKAGFDRIAPPDGAFYLYVDVSRFTDDSLQFVKDMLDETGIAATPGADFDEEHGRHFVRLCYAGTTADMAEAAARLRAWKRLKR